MKQYIIQWVSKFDGNMWYTTFLSSKSLTDLEKDNLKVAFEKCVESDRVSVGAISDKIVYDIEKTEFERAYCGFLTGSNETDKVYNSRLIIPHLKQVEGVEDLIKDAFSIACPNIEKFKCNIHRII